MICRGAHDMPIIGVAVGRYAGRIA
jgi:hypothetical protein